MKKLLPIILVLFYYISNGQAIIGMSPILSFTPANATTPISTVTQSTQVSFTSYIKNYGNTVFTGNISVQTKIDTTSTNVILDTTYQSITLAPNDSIPTTLSFTPSQDSAAFKTGGNGNTIVVWPLIISGTALDGDSVRATVWVNNPASYKDLNKINVKFYPNPITNALTIENPHNELLSYQIINSFGQVVTQGIISSHKIVINTGELPNGVYSVIINSDKDSKKSVIKLIK